MSTSRLAVPALRRSACPLCLRQRSFATASFVREESRARNLNDERSLEKQRAAMQAEIARKRESYQEKYAERLKEKAKEAGVETVEQLRMRRLLAASAAKANTSRAAQGLPAAATKGTPSPKPQAQSGTPDERLPIKPLGSILDLDKVSADGLGADGVGQLWTAYHSLNTSYLSAVIPVATYKKMLATATLFPEFVVPLARGPDGQGVEMWLLQWSRPTASASTVLFTPLAAYHARGTYAAPALILTHYAELTGSHGVALMRGERTEEAEKLLTADEAKVLVWRLQRFYNTVPNENTADGKRYRSLLEDFHRPRKEGEDYDVQQLVQVAYEI